MKPPVETVRVSQRSRDILVKLKRKTGIEHWNVLCRWAFCLSLNNQSPPPSTLSAPDSNVEMSWKVFAGTLSEVLPALLLFRALRDGVSAEPDKLLGYFKAHLERGILMVQNVKALTDLIKPTESSGPYVWPPPLNVVGDYSPSIPGSESSLPGWSKSVSSNSHAGGR